MVTRRSKTDHDGRVLPCYLQTILGFHTIPRDNRHSGHVCDPNKRNNQNLLLRVHQHGRHDVR